MTHSTSCKSSPFLNHQWYRSAQAERLCAGQAVSLGINHGDVILYLNLLIFIFLPSPV
jgi:hypothetical protein